MRKISKTSLLLGTINAFIGLSAMAAEKTTIDFSHFNMPSPVIHNSGAANVLEGKVIRLNAGNGTVLVYEYTTPGEAKLTTVCLDAGISASVNVKVKITNDRLTYLESHSEKNYGPGGSWCSSTVEKDKSYSYRLDENPKTFIFDEDESEQWEVVPDNSDEAPAYSIRNRGEAANLDGKAIQFVTGDGTLLVFDYTTAGVARLTSVCPSAGISASVTVKVSITSDRLTYLESDSKNLNGYGTSSCRISVAKDKSYSYSRDDAGRFIFNANESEAWTIVPDRN